MKVSAAVLTWNRFSSLKTFCEGYEKHCAKHQLAIFEDGGTRDDTVGFILKAARLEGHKQIERPELAALEIKALDGHTVFLGRNNLGVAGNTNRALRWFMEDTDSDYLCLCNDDLVIKGDFLEFYAKALVDTGIGLFCFCGFNTPEFGYKRVTYKGYTLKSLSRMTGAMMAIPRGLVQEIGYFDTCFGKFGEEHCAYTNRARGRGYQDVNGEPHVCLDVEHCLLEHAEVESTMQGQAKAEADRAAHIGTQSVDYANDGFYRPFQLWQPKKVDAVDGEGVREDLLSGYYNVGLKQAVAY